ncbi:hypothetical protein KY290_013434 [Solanum tuberosum]|uniref:DUF4218 domain-containing protein n=1 Tax=Solanum tuberosum TaxID=4113 RepID=A0ABQ7VNH1_SOLTU|nr:hypothetical protein KY285_012896 [Solanum tuberosum]KAH0769453.1 hypothetical protein KY290_013434 [Solanum tuberosum]
MNVKGKTKDTINTRLDLKEMNSRPELHPIQRGEKVEVPTACYTLSPEDKHKLCLFLKNLKVSDGFSSNISQCVNLKDHKISGLKSHDCHVLLHHILPLALCGSKELRIDDLKHIEEQIPIILCKLEKVFPPSFFDVMVHLPIHIASEAEIAGPIHYRWMYPVERWLYFLKFLIGNRVCPEGCIVEGYIAIECMTLCSRYLHRIDTKFNRPERNYDGGLKTSNGSLSIFCQPRKKLGAKDPCELEANELEQSHIYILKNCDEVLPYLEYGEYYSTLADTEWDRKFIEWFKDRVAQLHKTDNSRLMKDLLSLSRGPTKYSTHSNGYIVNGYRFHVEDHDQMLKTQNCGVVIVGENDKDSENVDYYGILTDVIELQFISNRRLILFRCKWFDVYDKIKGFKRDEYDFVSVNPTRLLKTNEPFILASQASQVFYANDNSNKGWHVVRKTQPCDSYEMGKQMDDDHVVVDVESPTQKKRKRTDVILICRTWAIGRGRGRGLKSLTSKGKIPAKSLLFQSSDLVKQYIKEVETSTQHITSNGGDVNRIRNVGSQENNNIHLLCSSFLESVSEAACQSFRFLPLVCAIGKGRGDGHKNSTISPSQVHTLFRSFTNQVKQCTNDVETRVSENNVKSTQELPSIDKNTLVLEKENTQNTSPCSTDQVMQTSQTTETVRGSNKCKEVASLEAGKKLKQSVLRHLGKIICDNNMCPLGVSSWKDIKQQRLDHMWAAIEDKCESVDFNDHRDHIFGWMNELWNKWRGYLHATYVKNKPIVQALKNISKGVEKKEWEWLVKEHFCSESFQGEKDGNPPNLATVFFETRKKDSMLVEPEAIEKHVCLPYLLSIEIVEKCCGPQNRSHVFGFGGGVKAKDMRGGTSSKAELLSELRSTQEKYKSLNEENKSLYDRLSTIEDDLKEIRKMKELLVAQQSHDPHMTSPISFE